MKIYDSLISVDSFQTIEKCFKNSNLSNECYLKGCKWSPDGKCLLTSGADETLRLFEVHLDKPESAENDIMPVLTYKEGGLVYDFQWYPSMDSTNPGSCVFASSSRDAPVHLWDAYTGGLRATYQPINQYDEVSAAYSVCFSPTGKLYCGLKKEIRVFDLSIPGRESERRCLKTNDGYPYQRGIVSSIAVNPAMNSLYALGSYDKSIGIYVEPDGELQCLLQAQLGGVTHLAFSPDGTRLYSGGRKDSEILCWDLRKPGTLLFTINRTVSTAQRIYFDLTPDGRFLFTGSTTGKVEIFAVDTPPNDNGILQSIASFWAHEDCTNGLSVHPTDNFLATASGQRHLDISGLSDSESDDDSKDTIENNVKIWRFFNKTVLEKCDDAITEIDERTASCEEKVSEGIEPHCEKVSPVTDVDIIEKVAQVIDMDISEEVSPNCGMVERENRTLDCDTLTMNLEACDEEKG